jgi:hypothetical protein
MAIDFYKLGRQSGATTPKGQQSGFQSLVSSATKPLEDMIKASQATTAALSAAMPAGIPIDKVPEQLRGKVSKYLADNKKEYTDAAKVVASGINPNSQRYRDAVETMNRVSTKFENLSNTLEDIAVKRKAALDDPSFSPATSKLDQLTFENLKNGSIYDSMNLNEDGTFAYQDGKGGIKQWKDFAITKQGFVGQQAFVGALEALRKYKKNTEDASWNSQEKSLQIQFDSLFQKLGPKGSLDYALADEIFLNEKFKGKDKDELIKNPNNVISEYKDYVMKQLKIEYDKMDSYKVEYKGTAADYDKMVKNKQIQKKFNTFMTPDSSSTGAGRTPAPEMPTPDEQINWFNTNINRNKTVVYNPVEKETGKVQKGYYEVIKYSDGSEELKLISPGINLRFEDMSLLIDYNQIARIN